MTRTDTALPNIDLSIAPITPSPWIVRMQENYNDLAYRIEKIFVGSPNTSYLLLLLIPIVFYLVEKRTIVGYTLSISIVSIIVVTCTSPKKKEFPFAALMTSSSGITSDTPSVGDNGSSSGNGQTTTSTGQTGNNGQTNSSTPTNNGHTGSNRPPSGNSQLGGGGANSAGTPVSGFYFLHRDYLDSVTMVTDAKGEMVSGMDISTGKSVIDYKPYGEIDRKNSDGPDIFRYKYTGQEEDRETGLYYYKARYYDPEIGRFVQPDSFLNPNTAFGMNQYTYVDGNPIMNNDPTGHVSFKQASHMFGMIFKSLTFQQHHHGNNIFGRKQSAFHKRLNDHLILLGRSSNQPTSTTVTTNNSNCNGNIVADTESYNPYSDASYNPCDDTESGEEFHLDPMVSDQSGTDPSTENIRSYRPYDYYLPSFNKYPIYVPTTRGAFNGVDQRGMVVRTNRKYADPFTICEVFDDKSIINYETNIHRCVFSGGIYRYSQYYNYNNDVQLWKCERSNKQQRPIDNNTKNSSILTNVCF